MVNFIVEDGIMGRGCYLAVVFLPFFLGDWVVEIWGIFGGVVVKKTGELAYIFVTCHKNIREIGAFCATGVAMGGDGCFMSGYDHAVPSAWAYSDKADGGIWEDGDVRKEESIR